MFEIISTCKSGRYVYCRTSPIHPKSNKLGLYSLHRVMVENSINRLLTDEELVHHINGNKEDNRIENLQIISNSEHGSLHHHRFRIEVVCEKCGKTFSKVPSQVEYNKRRGAKNFCSKSCAGKYYFKLNDMRGVVR